ncbi:hypothetical protein, partial [Polyangium sp. 15x6]|uniref:hypothetical protein n=1 Tax=Polyangium sp. 15x6 TaxID=3042687 RepID=UPI002499C4DC
MLLVAVESLGLAFATVAHLWIFDRDASILGDSFADTGTSAAGRLRIQILRAELLDDIEQLLEGRLLDGFAG